jgi:glucose/arabinose dehydrogenase
MFQRAAPSGAALRVWCIVTVSFGGLGAVGAMACADSPSAPPPPPPPPPSGFSLTTEVVAEGFASPVYLTSPTADARLFIVEQPGRVRIVASGQLLPTPFLDLTGRVLSGGERGLLSLAFHPDFASNGFLYVNYTDSNGDTRVERYTVDADPDRADPASAKVILRVTQPFSNHNGGQLQFGPDGMLYVFMGDGGAGGDPLGSGQDRSTLLGAVLRLDVDGGDPYAIPTDNPFVGQPAARPETWALGLRNPWRASFDRDTGTLYIADVGQNRVEEINAAPATAAGLNYGWNVTEGSSCFATDPCDTTGLTLPVAEYDHGQGCSVTGGYSYRGQSIPEVVGHYFYSDFCAGFLRSFRLEGGTAVDPRAWAIQGLASVTSFGEDAAGELYILSQDGRVLRLVRAQG